MWLCVYVEKQIQIKNTQVTCDYNQISYLEMF